MSAGTYSRALLDSCVLCAGLCRYMNLGLQVPNAEMEMLNPLSQCVTCTGDGRSGEGQVKREMVVSSKGDAPAVFMNLAPASVHGV